MGSGERKSLWSGRSPGVDIPPTAPDTVFRLINVHIDSLERLSYRTQQLEIVAKVLREPGCSGGFIGGDFNSISPGDDELVDKNGLVDAWLALHGSLPLYLLVPSSY